MKRFLRLVLMMLVSLSAVFGVMSCDNNATAPKLNLLSSDINVRYIRTNWLGYDNSGEIIPIHSFTALEEYLETYAGREDFGRTDGDGNFIRPEYFDVIEKNYTRDYFYNRYLVIVRQAEGSGGTRHKVLNVEQSGIINVNRLGIGDTADLASWSFLIELPNTFKPNEFKVMVKDAKFSWREDFNFNYVRTDWLGENFSSATI